MKFVVRFSALGSTDAVNIDQQVGLDLLDNIRRAANDESIKPDVLPERLVYRFNHVDVILSETQARRIGGEFKRSNEWDVVVPENALNNYVRRHVVTERVDYMGVVRVSISHEVDKAQLLSDWLASGCPDAFTPGGEK